MVKTIKEFAEMEGRCDGVSLFDRESSDLYTINDNATVNYIGFLGRMAYWTEKKAGEESYEYTNFWNKKM